MPFRTPDPGAGLAPTQDQDSAAIAAEVPFADLAVLGRNAWWRYLICIVVIAVATICLQFAMFYAAAWFGVRIDEGAMAGGVASYGPIGLDAYAFVMLSIAVMLPVTMAAVRWVHRRPALTLLTGRQSFAWSACLRSAGAVLATVAIMAVAWKLVWPEDIRFVFDPGRFFLFLPFILVLTPLQVLAEEVVFRGYILQGVARLTGLWLIRLLVPAILFTIVHIPNEEFQAGGWWAAADYAVIALYLGFLTLRGNGLEYATGVHLGLNTSFFVIVGYSQTWLRTPSIFLIDGYDFRIGLIGTLIICLVHYLAVMRRLEPADVGLVPSDQPRQQRGDSRPGDGS